jgi:hypothetical protein
MVLQFTGNEDGTRIWALRVKATIERARRLSEAFSDLLLQIYPKNVEVILSTSCAERMYTLNKGILKCILYSQ